jgi:hypothetical protein
MSTSDLNNLLLHCSSKGHRTTEALSWTHALKSHPDLGHVHKIIPVQVNIPHIFTNVNKYNNTFTLIRAKTSDPGTIITEEFTIPIGQYDKDQLVTLISALLTARIPEASAALNSSNASYLDITITDAEFIRFQSTSDVNFLLGTHLTDLTQTGTTFTFPYPLNLAPLQTLFLASNELGDGGMISHDHNKRNIVLPISLHDVEYGATMSFHAKDFLVNDVDYRRVKDLTAINLSIVDDQYRVLDLPLNYHVDVVFKVYNSGHL